MASFQQQKTKTDKKKTKIKPTEIVPEKYLMADL